MEEEHTIQWPKEQEQKANQRSTEHGHKTKDRVTRTTGSDLFRYDIFLHVISQESYNMGIAMCYNSHIVAFLFFQLLRDYQI